MPSAEETARIKRLATDLAGPFDFSIDRTPETLYHFMQTEFIHMGFDGKRVGSETYGVTLRGVPAAQAGTALDQYTCGGFCVRFDAKDVVTIPALADWGYGFDPMAGADGKSLVFGVPHDRFEGLTDSKGAEFSPDIRYAIYNNFIDFHALNNVFSRPLFGQGIERLKHIGDRMVHPAAFTEAPVNLGTAVQPGSVYHNGEVTLALKGVSLVDGAACAIVEYDSGESTLRMVMSSDQGGEVLTEGGSEYKGDLYIDLETGWVRKVTLDEFVETQSGPVGSKPRTHGCVVRHLLLQLISQEEYEKGPKLIS
jgi:hypothetical protein